MCASLPRRRTQSSSTVLSVKPNLAPFVRGTRWYGVSVEQMRQWDIHTRAIRRNVQDGEVMSTIYATEYETRVLSAWARERKPAMLGFIIDWTPCATKGVERRPIMRLSSAGDAWMLTHCPFEWITEQIKRDYGDGRVERDGEQARPWWRYGLKRKPIGSGKLVP